MIGFAISQISHDSERHCGCLREFVVGRLILISSVSPYVLPQDLARTVIIVFFMTTIDMVKFEFPLWGHSLQLQPIGSNRNKIFSRVAAEVDSFQYHDNRMAGNSESFVLGLHMSHRNMDGRWYFDR